MKRARSSTLSRARQQAFVRQNAEYKCRLTFAFGPVRICLKIQNQARYRLREAIAGEVMDKLRSLCPC
jgi:hypothetical protein